jgi:hypothetical protein
MGVHLFPHLGEPHYRRIHTSPAVSSTCGCKSASAERAIACSDIGEKLLAIKVSADVLGLTLRSGAMEQLL